MLRTFRIGTLFFVVLLTLFKAHGQSMRGSLEQMIREGYSEDAVRQYVKPFALAVGSNMASSLSFNAAAKQFPGFGLSAVFMSTSVPTEDRLFRDGNSEILNPTVFGPRSVSGSQLAGTGETRFPYPVLQLNMGLTAYLELVLRYTNWEIEQIGTVELRGFGIKYELIEILQDTGEPFYVSLIADYQNLQMDEYLESAAFGMAINVSRKFRIIPVTLLGGIHYANNILILDTGKLYPGSAMGNLNVEGLKDLIYGVSLQYSVSMLRFMAAYDLGRYQTLSIGMSVDF